jgi:hypothetical protein
MAMALSPMIGFDETKKGTGFKYTDPQIHSEEKEFGRADRGTVGFARHFSSLGMKTLIVSRFSFVL